MEISDAIQVSILLILTWQSYTTFKQLKLDYKWKRRKLALDYSHFTDKDVQKNIDKLNKVFPNYNHYDYSIDRKILEEAISKDPSIRITLKSLLAHWENLALAIESGLAEDELAFEMLAGTLTNYVKVFDKFIEIEKGKNIRVYSYLIKLSEDWTLRLYGQKNNKKKDFE